MVRAAATFGGVLVIGLLAAGLTEATLAYGGHGKLTNDALLRPATLGPSPTSTPLPTPTSSPSLKSTPATTSVPSTTPIVAILTATTNSFVHVRASNTTASPIITDLNAGTVVQILPIADAQWQQVRYNGQPGYIFRAYLTY